MSLLVCSTYNWPEAVPDRRARANIKTTTVRFGEDLWRLLEHESALAGVSVSQYIREAALARAIAAAAARGTGPFDVLAGAVRETVPDTSPERHREAERTLGHLARLIAVEGQHEARALKAQSRQAIRHKQARTARNQA